MARRHANDVLANLRLTWEPTWGRWSLQAHYLVSVEDGPAWSCWPRPRAVCCRPPPSTWFNLTDTFVNHGQVIGQPGPRPARARLRDTRPRGPRRPPGDDLGQRPGVPARWICSIRSRRPPPTPNTSPASTCSTSSACSPTARTCSSSSRRGRTARRRTADRRRQLRRRCTSHHPLRPRDHLAGGPRPRRLGRRPGRQRRALGGATWNLEVVPTFEAGGAARVSALANISDAVTLFRTATPPCSREYFHNGFGVAAGAVDLRRPAAGPDRPAGARPALQHRAGTISPAA